MQLCLDRTASRVLIMDYETGVSEQIWK
jgi:hypothetical protein